MRIQIIYVFMAFVAAVFFANIAGAKDLMAPDSEVAVLDTSMGQITIEFFPNAAPKHVENFKALANKGFYNGVKFHRVIKGFMIQAGDPNSKDNDPSNDGAGNAGYTLKQEFNSISHKRGIVSMARRGDSVDSASCQFFIMHRDRPELDNQYTVFGRVISGMDTVDKIAETPTGARDNPATPVVIKKVTIEKRTATQTAK
ncbi:peptidylprolyl isomerase [bacterium]|nr:peptidylprolyl isomerase [bacterium]